MSSRVGVFALLAASGCSTVLMNPAVVGGAASVAHCQPFSRLEDDVTFDQASPDAIVVFGVSQIHAMTFLSGIDDGVHWRRDRSGVCASARTEDGFVVARLKPRPDNKRYAVARVSLEPGATDCYDFPGTSTILVFDAPAGRVTYLGGLKTQILTEEGVGTHAVLRDDPTITKQQASAFMARRYPRISGELTTGRLEWVYKRD